MYFAFSVVKTISAISHLTYQRPHRRATRDADTPAPLAFSPSVSVRVRPRLLPADGLELLRWFTTSFGKTVDLSNRADFSSLSQSPVSTQLLFCRSETLQGKKLDR